jgi:hypothetical protein
MDELNVLRLVACLALNAGWYSMSLNTNECWSMWVGCMPAMKSRGEFDSVSPRFIRSKSHFYHPKPLIRLEEIIWVDRNAGRSHVAGWKRVSRYQPRKVAAKPTSWTHEIIPDSP